MNFPGFSEQNASAGALERLKRGGIRSLMVTGDNLLTAVNVAQRCGMVGDQCDVITVRTQLPGERGADGVVLSKPTLTFARADEETSSSVWKDAERFVVGSLV